MPAKKTAQKRTRKPTTGRTAKARAEGASRPPTPTAVTDVVHREEVLTVGVYRDAAKQYRWKVVHSNGNVMADSGEAYKRKIDCVASAQLVTGLSPVDIKVNKTGAVVQ